MPLLLTEAQVTQLLTMPDAVRAVEEAFRDLGQGNAINRPRQRVRAPNGMMHVMPAGMPARGYLGLKYYSGFRPKTRFWFHLLDANNGDLLCVMQADRLGQQRTGAASGVATKFLAREDASSVGIIGTGWQAASQLEAIAVVRNGKLRIAKCYSRDESRRKSFAKEMTAKLGIEVRAVETARDAVRDADILVTATGSREPVLLGDWLAPGTHINAVGSNRADAREIDDAVLSRATFICVDSVEQSKIESGDLILPTERGLLSWDRVNELSDVVAGKIQRKPRENRDDITLFKSIGIALEDVAVGAWVYARAREQGVGKQIEL
jgi:ornithine cyclodeaminase/alanine dehydrogenase-like protein (mu-crystallin family)